MKLRSSDIVKKKIIASILKGEYKINASFLPERELASYFQVGRPTIREALQGLEREGWITARKGMPPVVNDYWKHGNLMTIVNILQNYEEIPDIFVEYMLELRITLSPVYIKEAVTHHKVKVISFFAQLDELKDDAESFAIFDWELQQKLAQLSPNPVYLLIINSFADIYVPMAKKYFNRSRHRDFSRQYYDELLESILKEGGVATEQITIRMMKKSLQLWKENCEEEENKP